MRELILLFVFFPILTGFAEFSSKQQQADSLVLLLQTRSDSARIPVLLSLSWELRNTSPEKSVNYGLEAIELTSRYHDYENLAKAYSFAGVAYRIMGKYSETIDFFFKGLEIAEEHGIYEQEGYAHLNLANLYIYQEHSVMAMENVREAEVIAIKTGNKAMLAYAYLFLGRSYKLEGDLDKALESYSKSLSLRQELNQVMEQATCYKYIGDTYFAKAQFSTALEYYDKALARLDTKHDEDLYSNILIKKSMICYRDHKLNEASALAHQSLDIATRVGANMAIKDALQVLASISAAMNDHKTATAYLEKVIKYNDTLFSQKLSEKLFSLEYQLEKQQKEIKIDLLNKDNSIKVLELKRIRVITLALTVILILLISTFFILLILLRQRRARAQLLEIQNQEILSHRNSIEQQNKQLTEANERLQKSEDNLQRMVQTKDKLFSIIAHDLRNPFTALGGLTEVLQRNAASLEPKEVAEFASMLHESSQKLLNLIENLLQWANTQTGRLKLVPRSLQLKSLTEEVLRILINQAEVKGISLKNNIPADISVYADYESLSIIIRNLVSNGIKYTDKGGLVSISAGYINNNTVLTVTDTGIGISPETLEKLFRIEESFSTEGTNHEAGTGLGLIICKEFAEKNGGTITVESRQGKGTTFTVSMPGFPPGSDTLVVS